VNENQPFPGARQPSVEAVPLSLRGIRARPLDLPLRKPVETASTTLRTAPLVLVDISTEEGVVGCSYVSIYTPVALGPLARLIENLEPLLVGGSAEPARVEQALARHFKLLGLLGLTGIAAAAIDMALWDAQAKAVDLPLVRLLGGEPGPVTAYASLPSMDAAAAVADAQEALELGFSAFKIKTGSGDLNADLAVVRAVRDVIGADCAQMVDYNQALTVSEAIDRIRVLDAEGLVWVEEPTRADDFAGHARIAAAVETPIQLGENWWGPNEMEKSIAAAASQHVMFDAMKIGGVSGWLRAARLAQAAALPVSTHVFPEISSHLLAVTPTRQWLEYVDKVGPILTDPVRVEDGRIVIPDQPGVGIEWDEQAVAHAADA
jgi:mandelate racemase